MKFATFIHQKPYEHIVARVRRRGVTLLPAVAIFFILLAMPLAVGALLFHLFPTIITLPTGFPLIYPVGILMISIYYLSMLLFFYSYFLDFYLDVLVLTNDRLIDIEQLGLFAHRVSEVDLYKIQDITSEVNGVFASVFNYGTLSIQTAGAVDKFIIYRVPHPDRLRQEIMDLAEEDRKHHQ